MEFKHFINGQFVASSNGAAFENRAPVNNRLIGMVCEASSEDVDAAVIAAKAALKRTMGQNDSSPAYRATQQSGGTHQ